MEKTRASTPPSLLAMDRRIAYANRKYHLGLIWGGVLSGLAGCSCQGPLVGRVTIVLVLQVLGLGVGHLGCL